MQIDNMNKDFAEAVFKRKQPVQAPSKLCVKFHVSTSPSCHRLQFLASGFRYHTEAPACYNRARQHSKCRVLSHVEVWFPQALWIFLPITTLKVNPSNGSLYNNSSLFFGLGPLVPNEQLHCEQSPAAPFGHFGFTTSCDFGCHAPCVWSLLRELTFREGQLPFWHGPGPKKSWHPAKLFS